MALNKHIDAITEADLQALVTNGEAERKIIEYKQTLPINNHDGKREFLADVSSFSNSSGGDIVYGMKADAGIATELCGLQISDVDAEKLRLENMLRSGISPRIPGISIVPVSLQGSKVAIIIRIPRSWAQPHVVDFEKHWRFYARNSAGKYTLDVGELRYAFTLSDTLEDRIKRFRTERLSAIIADETPVSLEKGAKVVLHVVPIGAFDRTSGFDVASLTNNRSIGLAPLNSGGGWDHRHNFDGFLTYSQIAKSQVARSYSQFFRNGSIEAIEMSSLRNREDKSSLIYSMALEDALIGALPNLLSVQKGLGVVPPIFIMLSLLGVAGYTIYQNNSVYWSDDSHPVDRDNLIIPEIMIEDITGTPATILRPAFDAIWNAAGYARSMNYDADGKWVHR